MQRIKIEIAGKAYEFTLPREQIHQGYTYKWDAGNIQLPMIITMFGEHNASMTMDSLILQLEVVGPPAIRRRSSDESAGRSAT